ncbi:hypothetical protein HDV02_001208 [Globomyces sp. JEL0801]|nr:hypothetical protein HDV02_001208 [Globomyces sp. JEL0801]
MQTGIEIIQKAYQSSQAKYMNDLNHYKQLNEKSMERQLELEQKNSQLSKKISELDKIILFLKNENQHLTVNFNALSVRHSNLKKTTSQLEAFRKSMVNMIQNSPGMGEKLDEPVPEFTTSLSSGTMTNVHEDSNRFSHSTAEKPQHSNSYQNKFHLSFDEKLLQRNDMNKVTKSELLEHKPSYSTLTATNSEILDSVDQLELHTLPNRHVDDMPNRNIDRLDNGSGGALERIRKLENIGLGLIHTNGKDYDSTEQSYFTDSTIPLENNMDLSGSSADKSGLLTLELLNPQSQIYMNKLEFPHTREIPTQHDTKSANKPTNDANHANQSSPQSIPEKETAQSIDDPALIYKQIQQRLTQKGFDEFANIIGLFNNGHKNANEAVNEIRRIVGDEVLCAKMTRLIYEAANPQ